MKNTGLKLVAVLGLSAGLFAFGFIDGGIVVGKVAPAESVDKILAVQGTDTLAGSAANGELKIEGLKAGTYTVIVKAKAPFKDAQVENVTVGGSDTTKLADITLQQ